jgi:hypothetical protein
MSDINLLPLLNSYGDIFELDYKFDSEKVINELEQLEWEAGPNGKFGLNLTGPLGDLSLDSKDKHNENQGYNQNLGQCPSLMEFFVEWENLARCRAAKMSAGSFFSMHRDAFRMNPQIRIFIPLNKTAVNEWNFIYEDKRVEFKPGVPYILNTRKQHGSFAMADGIYHILMSVFLTESNLKTIISMLPNCKEN